MQVRLQEIEQIEHQQDKSLDITVYVGQSKGRASTADLSRRAIEETNRRREIQASYNTEHNITPRGVDKAIDEGLRAIIPQNEDDKKTKLNLNKIPKDEYASLVKDLTGQMNLASANLEFERAAELRDVINEIKGKM